MTLHEKLIELRKAVPYAQEDAQGYQYKYVSGTSLLAVLRPKMDKLGVLLIPSTGEYTWTETIKENQKGEKSALFVVTLDMTMTWVNAEKPEEKIDVPFSAFGAQDDISKAFGSALTYSERYFLLKFFSIPTDKLDPDSFGKQNNPKPKPATQVQEKAMFKAAKESGWSKEAAGQYLADAKGIKNFADLDQNEAEALTDYFKRTPREKSDGPGSQEDPDSSFLKFKPCSPRIYKPIKDLLVLLKYDGPAELKKRTVDESTHWNKLRHEDGEKWLVDLQAERERTNGEPPGDNPEDWFPNDKLQVLFDKSDIPLKTGGDKIRQYMAREGLTGDEVEAKLERLGIYKSAGAWETLHDKVFIPGEAL